MSLKFGITIGALWTGAGAFANSSKSIRMLDAKVKRLNQKKIKLKADSKALSALNKQIAHTEHKIKQLNKTSIKMDSILKQRDKFKSSLMDKAVMVGSVFAPLKVAIDFESAMADVKKVVNFDSKEQFGVFSNQTVNLSKNIPLTATGLADIAAQGGQLGITKSKLLDFTQTTAKMATAFDMAPAEAGEASAKLMNIFDLGVGGVSSLGDAINHLSDNTAAKASSVVNVLTRIGGQAKLLGLSGQQASSLASAFISLGKPPEVAATAINALLLKLGTADKQGRKFQGALAAIGLDATELKERIAQDGEGAILSFLEQLEGLDKDERLGVLSDLFGAEYADDIALLTGGLDSYRKSIKLVSKAQNYQNSMQREFENRSQTTSNNLTLLGNNLSAIAINVGSLLLPAINSIVTPIGKVLGGVANWAVKFPTVTKVLAGLTVGIIGVSVVASALAFMGGFVAMGWLRTVNIFTLLNGHLILSKGLMLASKSATLALTSAQWLLNAALNANPIGLLITGIALGAFLIYKYWQPIKGFFMSIWTQIKTAFSGGLLGIGALILDFSPVGLFYKAFAGVMDWFGVELPTSFSEFGKNMIGGLLNGVLGGLPKLGGVIDTVKGWFGFGDEAKASKAITSNKPLVRYSQPPKNAIKNASSNKKQVTQNMDIKVNINNPSSTVDVERAITNAMQTQGTSLADEDI